MLLFAGCGGSDDNAPVGSASLAPSDGPAATPITLSGEITQVVAPVQDQSLGAIVVEPEPGTEGQVTRAGITVDDATVYSRNDGGATVPATFDELKVGGVVEVTFRGTVAGSVILSGRAGEIRIVE